jgi:hypothetical protein
MAKRIRELEVERDQQLAQMEEMATQMTTKT